MSTFCFSPSPHDFDPKHFTCKKFYLPSHQHSPNHHLFPGLMLWHPNQSLSSILLFHPFTAWQLPDLCIITSCSSPAYNLPMASYLKKNPNFLPWLIQITWSAPACFSHLIFSHSPLFTMLQSHSEASFLLFINHSWFIHALQPFTNWYLCLKCSSLDLYQPAPSCHSSISLKIISSEKPFQINCAGSERKGPYASCP